MVAEREGLLDIYNIISKLPRALMAQLTRAHSSSIVHTHVECDRVNQEPAVREIYRTLQHCFVCYTRRQDLHSLPSLPRQTGFT